MTEVNIKEEVGYRRAIKDAVRVLDDVQTQIQAQLTEPTSVEFDILEETRQRLDALWWTEREGRNDKMDFN